MKFLRVGGAGIVAALALLLVGLPTPHASAATCSFASVGDNDFNTAANWDCAAVPGAADTVVIPAATSTSLSGAVTIADLLVNTNATFTTTGFDLVVQGSATSSGDIIAGGNTITIGDDLEFLSGFTFTPGTGTLRLSTSTVDFVENTQRFIFPSAVTLNHFDASSTNAVQLIGSSLVTVGGNFTLMGAGGTTVGSGVTMNVTGTTYVSSTGSLITTDTTNTITITATTTIEGTISATGGGAYVFNGDVVNLAAGRIRSIAAAGSFTFKQGWTNDGLFTSGSSTVSITGTVAQAITGDLTFYNLTATGPGTKTFSGHVTTTGDLNAAIVLAFSTKSLEVQGNVTSTNGLNGLTFVRVSGGETQTWTGSAGSPDITGTTYVSKDADTTLTFVSNNEFLGDLIIQSGIVVASSDTLTFSSNNELILAGGTFQNGGGTVDYSGGSSTVGVASTTFNNLAFTPTVVGTYSLTGTTFASGTTSLDGPATLNLQGFTYYATGLFTNLGLIVLNGGSIVHPAESVKITDSSGVEVASISTDGTLYVTVQDSNRNLASSTAETMTVSVSGNAAAGSDVETLTLTETGAATGIFRNTSAINVVNSSAVSTGNGQFEMTGSGVLTVSYTDNQDATDTGSDTTTLTYTAASAASSGGGGGGGGGYIPISLSYQVSTQDNTANLSNLQNIGVAVHNLVKLPDDGDASTQHDTAVYYVGSDGKRHAFPNDKVYFTWYASFDGVQIINQTQLASIPLGANVTYKPGVKMVKFTTDPKVYVVAKGGVLRWVTSEAAANELYSAAWNTMIDDINDAFYANYTFGTDVTGLTDFNPALVEASVSLPSDSLQM